MKTEPHFIVTFFLICSYVVTSVYTLGGVVYLLISANSNLRLAGVGVLIGGMAMAYGITLQALIYFCPKPVGGLIVILSGVVLYVFLQHMKGTQDPQPLVVSMFVISSFISGLGLMVTGFVN